LSPGLDFIDREVLGEWLLLERLLEQEEQLPDRHRWESRQQHFLFAADLVAVPTSDAGLGQVAGFLEVVDDLSGRSFGDPDAVGDVSQACIRVGGDVGENVAVVGDQTPTRMGISGT
jgi:hypothetical protein